MQKKSLIARAEKWQQSSKERPLMGYARKNQPEIVGVSVAIIKALCEMDGMTPFRAKEALKMAADIIDEATQNETIA